MDKSQKVKGNLSRINSEHELISSLKDYLDIALLKGIQTKSEFQHPDKIFNSNTEFWTNSIQNKLYAGQIIKLNNFNILEWIPASPGLFYTPHAESQRRAALRSHEKWRHETENIFTRAFVNPILKPIELRPDEKMGMVQGGYGSLRVAPKFVNNELQHIVCASSNGVSHEGLAITLKQSQFVRIIEDIRGGKIPIVNITGRLMILPKELSPINLKYHDDIPKFYLDVEELEIIKTKSAENAIISVAITYSKVSDYLRSSSFSYSFCSFSPTENNKDLKEAVLWLQDYAVRYSEEKDPIIIGDFDEEYNHFENVEFPIKEIANGRIPMDKLLHFKQLFHLEINELFMGDKNVFNQSTIGAVGSNATSSNNTFQQVNYSFPDNFDYGKLNEQLTVLRENLVQNAKTPDEFKAIGDVAAAELASKEKDGNKVVKHLKDAGKWVFDTATKIGVSVVSEIIKQQM